MTDDVTPRIAAVPLQDAADATATTEAPPRRGRGRPRKDDTAPRAPSTRRRKVSVPLETRIGASIVKINLAVGIASKFSGGIIRPDDALDKYEIIALSQAIAAQAREHPTFRRYVEYAVTGTENTDILLTLGVIVARRAARRGVLPEDVEVYGSILVGDPTHADELAAMMSAAMAASASGENDGMDGTE